jgi:NAD(P)H-binding
MLFQGGFSFANFLTDVPALFLFVVWFWLLVLVYADLFRRHDISAGVRHSGEWIIRSSGLEWTVVRPGLLTDRSAIGQYRILTKPKDWRFGVISRADVANFLVRQIDNRALIGSTPLLIS